jgi:hypothetical protein
VAALSVGLMLAYRAAVTQRPLVLVRGLRAADELAGPTPLQVASWCHAGRSRSSSIVGRSGTAGIISQWSSVSFIPPREHGRAVSRWSTALCPVRQVPAAAIRVHTTLDDPAPIDEAAALGAPYFHVPILPTTLPGLPSSRCWRIAERCSGVVRLRPAWLYCETGGLFSMQAGGGDGHAWMREQHTRLVVIAPPRLAPVSSSTQSRGRFRGGFAKLRRGYN